MSHQVSSWDRNTVLQTSRSLVEGRSDEHGVPTEQPRAGARAPGRPGDLWHLMILCSQESSQVPTIKCLKVPDQDGGEYTDGASSAVGSRLGSPESTQVGVDAPLSLTPPPLSPHASARADAKAASRPDCDPTGVDRSRPDVSRSDCDSPERRRNTQGARVAR